MQASLSFTEGFAGVLSVSQDFGRGVRCEIWNFLPALGRHQRRGIIYLFPCIWTSRSQESACSHRLHISTALTLFHFRLEQEHVHGVSLSLLRPYSNTGWILVAVMFFCFILFFWKILVYFGVFLAVQLCLPDTYVDLWGLCWIWHTLRTKWHLWSLVHYMCGLKFLKKKKRK